ncbi:MAG: TIR domain-containing protein [Chloroflexi bacterium]|nr:TIR domain-containing protein [Chloroflexota bacterium]MDL1884632.1 TIR domain-containing protein [Anaerolineae bacterium CFX8]
MDPVILVVIVIVILAVAGGVLLWRRRSLPANDTAPGIETIAVMRDEAPAAPPQSPPPQGKPASDDLLDPEISATLEIISGPDARAGGVNIGKHIPVRKKKTTLGRNPRQVDIQLYNLDEPSSVSRLHCSIEYYASMRCFMITDEGSSSGTKVDNLSLTSYQPVALRDGDLIELGLVERQGVVIRFHTDANPPESEELHGARLRLHMGIEAKDTIRQLLKEEVAPEVTPCDVFLSYSRRDRDVMRYIRESLEVSGISVWSDENLEPGSKSWRGVVETAIERAGCLVALLSPDAKQSEWVGEELNYAKIHGVRIFTVLVRGEEGSAIPLGLTGMQWVDMRTDYEGGLEHLLKTLREYLARE